MSSNSAIPFFDIEYRTVLKIIFKNFDKELAEVPPNKEFFILNKHIHVFERLFGFKFRDNKSVSAITNQSFVGMDLVYPESKETVAEPGEPPLPRESGSMYLERQEKKKSFHVFSEESTILTDAQAFEVDSPAERAPALHSAGVYLVSLLLQEGARDLIFDVSSTDLSAGLVGRGS